MDNYHMNTIFKKINPTAKFSIKTVQDNSRAHFLYNAD